MEEKTMLTLIMNEKSFFIPTNFNSLNDIDHNVYLILITQGQYYVKSNVSEEVFQSFLNHWTINETPNIQFTNIYEYFKLSQEFDRMKDIIQMFQEITQKGPMASELQEKKSLKGKKESRNNYLNEITISYRQIIHHIFTNQGIDSNFSDIKDNLYKACIKRNVRYVDALTQKHIEINRFLYSINENEQTAGLLDHQFPIHSINIPSTIIFDSKSYPITIINKNCFSHQKFITTINFSEDSKLKIIDVKSFIDSSIEGISIPSTVTEICDSAFQYCLLLKKVEFSEKSELRTIGHYSFYGSSIERISIPKHVILIGDYSFYNCSQFKKIEFSENSELQQIGQNVFSNSSLERILIPSQVKQIGYKAFSNCKQLKKVEFSENSELESIEESAFDKSSIESLIITSTKNIEFRKKWCIQTHQLNNIKINPKNNFFFVDENKNFVLKKSDIMSENYDILLFAGRKIENAIIPPFITKISSCSFNNCKLLKKVDFSEHSKLKTIEEWAFTESSLESIQIPSSVTLIDDYSFFYCFNLKQIEFSNQSKLRTIGLNSFSETQIESISIPPQVEIIKESAFAFCKLLKKIEFLERSESNSILICKMAVYNSGIECLSLPLGIVELEDGWCKGTLKLTKIILNPKNKDFLFYENKYLLKKSTQLSDDFDCLLFARRDIYYASIPQVVKKISPYAFEDCRFLKSVEFSVNHSKISSIGDFAFEFSTLEHIRIPSSVVSIGKAAFQFCDNLKSIVFDENSNLSSIEEYCFSETQLSSFSVPPHLKKIDSSFFFRCVNLKIFEISENSEIESLDIKVFNGTSLDIIMIAVKIREKIHFGI